MSHRKLVKLAALSFISGLGEFATADIIPVSVDSGTIQGAIDIAVSGADEIVVAPGTYNEVIDFLGKAITLRSGLGAAVTIIDATDLFNTSVVSCVSGEGPGTVLNGFTLTGALGNGDGGGHGEYRQQSNRNQLHLHGE